jgi:hypothetical protein
MFFKKKKIDNHALISSLKFRDDEYEIMSAEAKHWKGENKISGELKITNKNIVFSSKSLRDIYFKFSEIELIKSKKFFFALKEKLTIVVKKEENIFQLNYSKDWVKLIEELLKFNSNPVQ